MTPHLTPYAELGASQEVCIIDTILEEQANERQVQDMLNQELSDNLVEQQDPQSMSLVHGHWRKKGEILPLLSG